MQRRCRNNIFKFGRRPLSRSLRKNYYTTQLVEVCTVSTLRFHLTLLQSKPQGFLKTGQTSAEQTVPGDPPPLAKHRTRSPRGRKLSKMDLIPSCRAAEWQRLMAEGQEKRTCAPPEVRTLSTNAVQPCVEKLKLVCAQS